MHWAAEPLLLAALADCGFGVLPMARRMAQCGRAELCVNLIRFFAPVTSLPDEVRPGVGLRPMSHEPLRW